MLPILPRHKLEAALSAGNARAGVGNVDRSRRHRWNRPVPPPRVPARASGSSSIATPATGARRRTATRCPTSIASFSSIVPDQNAELLRLQSGATDLTHSELRSDDYIPVRRAEEEGKLTMVELGVGPDADALLVLSEAGEEGAATRASPSSAGASSGRRSRTRSIARRSPRRCSSARPSRSGARSRRATGSGSRRTSRAIRTIVARARTLLAGHRPRGSQRQRRRRGQSRDRGTVHRDHAAGDRLLRARHDGPSRTGGRGRRSPSTSCRSSSRR